MTPTRAEIDRPRYAMISTWIKRDLHDPLRYFQRLRPVHLYQHAIYQDAAPGELADAQSYRSPPELYRRLCLIRPAIVQNVEPLALMTLPYLCAAWLYARRRRLPLVVVSPENRPLDAKYHPLVGRALRAGLRPYLASADLVIYLNEGARRNLLAAGARPERLRSLMYGAWGVDPAEFTPAGPAHRDPRFGRYLLYVGRMDWSKGLDDLLAALAMLAERHRDLGLLLVGGGPDEPAIRRRASELGIAERVRFVGAVLNRDLPAYFRGAAAFVLPSRSTRAWAEQIGMVNIQAMACGAPVVTTRSGSIPEYVSDGVGGLLVPERDPAALAGALARLLNRPDLAARLGASARATALERYDSRRNIQLVEAALLELLGQAAPAAGGPPR